MSNSLYQSSVHLSKDVTVEWRALKPDWSGDRNPFSSKYWYNWSKTSFSKSLAMTGSTEIGRWLDISHFSPSLKIGVTLAIFHESENVLVSIAILKRCARDPEMNGNASLRK